MNYEAIKHNIGLATALRDMDSQSDEYTFILKATDNLSNNKQIDYERLNYEHLKTFYSFAPTLS